MNLRNLKRISLAVTNDLVSEQRVNKVCLSLIKWGYDVELIGILRPNSLQLEKKQYRFKRFGIFFQKGPLFYAEYNLRLFFILLFRKQDVIVANDLDSLLACFLVAQLKKKMLVYDSHEYFTEVPELIGRKAQKVWLAIEKKILPKVKNSYTVCDSIANVYNELYGIEMRVVRNLPLQTNEVSTAQFDLDFQNKSIILYQGALNIGRGLEPVIKAMTKIENALFLIIGDGDIKKNLEALVSELELKEKVLILGKKPYSELFQYTQLADVGISVEQDLGLNYRYALPNKLFDYIKAQVPILITNLPEMQKIMDTYEIGISISDFNEENIVSAINELIGNNEKRKVWKQNLAKAAIELNWEQEEAKLFEVYHHLIK